MVGTVGVGGVGVGRSIGEGVIDVGSAAGIGRLLGVRAGGPGVTVG